MLLKNSVGRKCINNKTDVKLVQETLNRTIKIPYALLKVDGIAGAATCLAIDKFQKTVLGFQNPDGRIDVPGKTWNGLKQYLIDTPLEQSSIYAIFKTKDLESKKLVTSKKIAWGAKVSGAFKTKVIEICEFLDLAPDYLMSCMAFETGESFSPSIKNAAGSGATGLIQFMPTTAKGLGTTTEKLAKMSAMEQLDYVKKYFAPHRYKLKKLEDVYMAILYPAALANP